MAAERVVGTDHLRLVTKSEGYTRACRNGLGRLRPRHDSSGVAPAADASGATARHGMSYHFAAEIPEDLADEVRRTIDRVRGSNAPAEHREEGGELVLRLTKACLDGYFLAPVRALGVGFVAERATTLGVNAAHRTIALFVRKITRSLSGEQVLKLADMLEGMMFTRDTTE